MLVCLQARFFAALGSSSFVQTDSPDTVAGATAASAAAVASMELVAVLNVQPNGTASWVSHDERVHFSLVRGDYLTLTATTANGLCDVVFEWGEAV